MAEPWERVLEIEFEFYRNIQNYEDDLMDCYYRSQVIDYPVTKFDDVLGVYLSCQRTEVQVMRRMESKAAIESILSRAVKRIKRLLDAIQKLEEKEQNVIWMFYIEKDMPVIHLASYLNYRTKKEFMFDKDRILKKLFAIYEKERLEAIQEREEIAKEELLKKAALFKESLASY